MKTITILVLDGVLDSSLAITLDTLRTAHAFMTAHNTAPQVQVRTIAAASHVTTACGLRMKVDLTFKTAQDLASDWVVVPGLGMRSAEEIRERLAQGDALQAMKWLARAGEGKRRIAASCSSVFMLAEAGLLHEKNATTSWWLATTFRERYPDVTLDEARMLVRDGPRLTAGAALSQLDLMLAIVAEVMGKSVAHLCSRYLLIDQRSSQARYMIQSHLKHEDQTVIAAERWIDKHLSEPIAIKILASELAISSKTLARRIEAATGVSPIKFIQRRRLLRAAHLIETSALSIEAVAEQVGYRDSTALRKLIKREFGITPSSLR